MTIAFAAFFFIVGYISSIWLFYIAGVICVLLAIMFIRLSYEERESRFGKDADKNRIHRIEQYKNTLLETQAELKKSSNNYLRLKPLTANQIISHESKT